MLDERAEGEGCEKRERANDPNEHADGGDRQRRRPHGADARYLQLCVRARNVRIEAANARVRKPLGGSFLGTGLDHGK